MEHGHGEQVARFIEEGDALAMRAGRAGLYRADGDKNQDRHGERGDAEAKIAPAPTQHCQYGGQHGYDHELSGGRSSRRDPHGQTAIPIEQQTDDGRYRVGRRHAEAQTGETTERAAKETLSTAKQMPTTVQAATAERAGD